MIPCFYPGDADLCLQQAPDETTQTSWIQQTHSCSLLQASCTFMTTSEVKADIADHIARARARRWISFNLGVFIAPTNESSPFCCNRTAIGCARVAVIKATADWSEDWTDPQAPPLSPLGGRSVFMGEKRSCAKITSEIWQEKGPIGAC